MTKQIKHIRTSKRGKRFKAGRRKSQRRFIERHPQTGMLQPGKSMNELFFYTIKTASKKNGRNYGSFDFEDERRKIELKKRIDLEKAMSRTGPPKALPPFRRILGTRKEKIRRTEAADDTILSLIESLETAKRKGDKAAIRGLQKQLDEMS